MAIYNVSIGNPFRISLDWPQLCRYTEEVFNPVIALSTGFQSVAAQPVTSAQDIQTPGVLVYYVPSRSE